MSGALLVLCYHAIADLSGDPVLADYGIDRETFAAQLDDLNARGFSFVTPDELLALLDAGRPVPPKAVLLTFDDCYEELADVAASILEPRGIKGIAFAVSGMASATNEWDQAIGARKLRLLDADGLKRLQQHGVEIGCHSHSHRPMSSLSARELPAETGQAADDIAALGVPRPRFFAYPHGQHDEQVHAAVESAGFAAAFGLLSRRVTPESARFALPRVEILARDRGWRFRFKTSYPRLVRLLRIRAIVTRLGKRAARCLLRTPRMSS
jgi:peptidoglycan/xylan/chitin deacetylase (PgdA/CDA1 family)